MEKDEDESALAAKASACQGNKKGLTEMEAKAS
jgi:hypothetical protein